MPKRKSLAEFESGAEAEEKAKPVKAAGGKVHTSVYLDVDLWEKVKLLAVRERKKSNDLIVEGLDLLLKARGLPGVR